MFNRRSDAIDSTSREKDIIVFKNAKKYPVQLWNKVKVEKVKNIPEDIDGLQVYEISQSGGAIKGRGDDKTSWKACKRSKKRSKQTAAKKSKPYSITNTKQFNNCTNEERYELLCMFKRILFLYSCYKQNSNSK